MKKLILAAALCASLPLPLYAAAIPQLKAFIAGSSTLAANFTQVVTSKNKHDEASGTLSISRPGRFRWSYDKPYRQLIVGDGKRLWIYDLELAQVTTHPLDAALGSSPAALLAGSNAIERDYVLKEAGKQGAIEWLSASPRKAENTFSGIRMGFRDNSLIEMQLTDNFGNSTHITFTALRKNPALDGALFRFTPPKGVDVISN
ncbi:outer membrane lipoprotein chaperone LolA [Paludibacterium yongneupense]|uniref:outer membrane lipoprotein chaperone LolA n=1 Tax=Paludibacterium yongneupense TaxID=400061 RepID=UPI00042561F1|nr:outer membrane lipoprotein chaperone LolA [Paludibacterium yongneupense]